MGVSKNKKNDNNVICNVCTVPHNSNACVGIVPGLGFKEPRMSFCIRFRVGGACHSDFSGQNRVQTTSKWKSAVPRWLVRFPPILSNHTNPERVLILAFLAIPKTVPKIRVASVSLALFFLLFTRFTTFHRRLLKSSRYTLEPLEFPLLWFGNLDLFSLRDSWHASCRKRDILTTLTSSLLGSAPRTGISSLPSI